MKPRRHNIPPSEEVEAYESVQKLINFDIVSAIESNSDPKIIPGLTYLQFKIAEYLADIDVVNNILSLTNSQLALTSLAFRCSEINSSNVCKNNAYPFVGVRSRNCRS